MISHKLKVKCKKAVEWVNSVVFSQQNLVFYGLAILLIVLHKPFELILSITFVKYVFSYVESIWYNDIIFGLVIVFNLILLIYKFGNYTPSKSLAWIFVIFTLAYCFYRFLDKVWDFTPISITTQIKYSDVIIVLTLFNLLLFWKKKKERCNDDVNSFYDDEPIGKDGIDELGYTSYAKLVSSKIKSSYFNKSFAIGINGNWGLGKTSFIDLIKREMNENDVIEVNFKPWNSNSPKAIIQDFFETIQESITPYHSTLSRLMISYSNKLISLNENTVTQSIQTSLSALKGIESLNSMFDEINNALISIDKKVIIYIDDLDRLDKDEIVEVIRLIRNTANFHNTFFVVAYDRNYVINALKKYNKHKREQFLEKIFQIEITLPYFKKDIFRVKLAEKIRVKITEDYHEEIEKVIIGTPSEKPAYMDEWLQSMRDVTRLSNAIILNIDKLKGEIVFKDFLRLEILRINYPAVYEKIFKDTEELFELKDASESEYHYVLKRLNKDEKKALEVTAYKDCDTQLELFIRKNNDNLSVPNNEIEKIVNHISGIFVDGSLYNRNFRSRSHLSIVYPSKFNRYFAYNLLEGSLSEIEFSNARTLDQNNFNSKILEWVNKKLEYELIHRFQEIKSFDNREDFEKVIRAIFYLANQKTSRPNFLSRGIIGYDGKDLFNKLSNYKNKLGQLYYKDLGEAEGLKKFVLGLFKEAQSPFAFEADLVRFANDDSTESFPLSAEELKELSIFYFKTYCSTCEMLDSHVWSLFDDCKQTIWVPTSESSRRKEELIPKEAIEIMVDFVLRKDLNGFLYAIITDQPFDRNKFAVNDIVLKLFGNWKSFKEVLEKEDEGKWSYLKDFKEFLLVFEGSNFSKYVAFEFKVIPIKDKNRE